MVTRMNACNVADDPEVHALTLLLRGAGTTSEPPSVRLGPGGALTRVVEGVVRRVHAADICLFAPASAVPGRVEEVHVRHELPASLDLRPLVGRAVRVTTVYAEVGASRPDSTLTVADETGRVWLIARSGTVDGASHALSREPGAPVLHAALSQRPAGPLVIGTAALQWLVPMGKPGVLHLPDGSVLRAVLVSRSLEGTASYVIADARLFASELS
jgi:hypothetical protein